jgi:CRISPR system Cascade subunit CasE
MSYVSQIRVDKAEAARLRLRDSYAWHGKLWQAFPGRDGAPRTFLFRVDDRHDYFRVLLLSPGAPLHQAWGTWEIKAIGESFLAHERYRFQLRANPTVKRVVRGDEGNVKKNGRRTGIYDADGLRAWMERKAKQSGFELLQCGAGPAIPSFFVKDGRRGKQIAVDFEGALRVTDSAVFKGAFQAGIGPAKAFGFGLLMLQPIA